MFTGFKPYEEIIAEGTTAQELIRAITEDNLRPAIPERKADGTLGRLNLAVPPEFLDLTTECWHKNPLRRPSVKEIEARTLEIIEQKQLVRTTNTMGKQQQALLQVSYPAPTTLPPSLSLEAFKAREQCESCDEMAEKMA